MGSCYCSFMVGESNSYLSGIGDTEDEQERCGSWLKKFAVLDLASLESQFVEGEKLLSQDISFSAGVSGKSYKSHPLVNPCASQSPSS